MKRNNCGKSKSINWKYCFICQNKRKPPDNTTEESLKTLCGNLTTIWELGELDLEWESMGVVTNEDGKPDLFESVKDKARFHRKCTKAYDKQKIERILAKRNANKDMETLVPPVTRSSVGKKRSLGDSFCVICGEDDGEENLHAAGTLHASSSSTDASHINALVSQWKSMALKVGNDGLLSHLSSGDTCSNELYYHGQCNIDLWNECNKIDAAEKSNSITWKKAQAFHSVVTNVIEQVNADSQISIPVKELNQLYVSNLK